ncbi:hypothetical protein CNR22_13440 [Sphingobacteriaceae bacterium]|nr:hypothetical protein CNR22_13440 [Sphingobacteriaceae bacterium]
MDIRIFYSWQLTTNGTLNKNFIESCIQASIKKVKKELKLPDAGLEIIIDRDTKDVPGTPAIFETLEDKIDNCDIFISDLSVVNQALPTKKNTVQKAVLWINNKINPAPKIKPFQNNNVFIEYGMARKSVGSERMIAVLNAVYGNPSEDSDSIPFDVHHLRWPIQYTYDNTEKNNKETAKISLTNDLAIAIKSIINSEGLRQRSEFAPFKTYNLWQRILNPEVSFEGLEIVKDELNQVRQAAINPNKSLRILGLSAMGKTRLVFEALSDKQAAPGEVSVSNKVLYVDCYTDGPYQRITEKITELVLKGKKEITIVADNCDFETFKHLNGLVKMQDSRISLVSIYSDPTEYKVADVDYIDLKREKYEKIIASMLEKSFPEISQNDRKKIVELCQGLTELAIIIAREIKQGKLEIRNVADQEVLKKIVGSLGDTPMKKALLMSMSIFLRVGFYDEFKSEFELIISDPDIVGHTDSEQLRIEFENMYEQLRKRGLIEKEGRFISIRPKPIAIALAAEWWHSCSIDKAQRIITKLQNQNLGVQMCEQMKYLSFLEEAQETVKSLCGENAPFGSAEVLRTDQGSRLFRSIVDVNPEAAMDGLETAFLNCDISLIESVVEGRRNLVWALEKLCFRQNLFSRASQMLGSFAVGEVETHISNNATGQFIHLFQIQLAGTQADLKTRFDTLIKFTRGKTKLEVILGIKALQRALMAHNFMRMSGAEDQGTSVTLRDYQPRGKEIGEYWKSVLTELTDLINHNDIEIAGEAKRAFLQSFGNLITVGAFEIVLPYIQNTKNLSLDEWKDVRGVLLRVKKYHANKLKPEEKIELQKLLDNLSPQTLKEKYLNLVGQPSFEDIEEHEDYHEKARVKSVEFADILFNDKSIENDTIFDLFYKGEQQYGFYFGSRYAELLGDQKMAFIRNSINYLKNEKNQNTNVTVLAGIISTLEPQNQALSLTIVLGSLKESDIFWLFSVTNVSLSSFMELVEHTIKNNWDVKLFLAFKFGRGIENLSDNDSTVFFDKLNAISLEAKAVTLSLVYYLEYNNKSRTDYVFNYLKKLMTSTNLLLAKEGYLDAHTWRECAQKLISEYDLGAELHIIFTKQIIDFCSDGSRILSNYNMYLKNLLSFLIKGYFVEIWPIIANALERPMSESIVRYNLKHLLESDMGLDGNESSVLFNIPDRNFELIMDWCRSNPENNAPIIAEMVLLYKLEGERFTWHPFALEVLQEFGKIDAVRRSMSSNFGTYGWTGSIVPLLVRQRRMFQELKTHSISEVVDWANKYLEYLNKEIKSESYEDEEFGGY